MSRLSLNCLIDGEDQMKVFVVVVEKTENVGFLKDLIKEKRARRLAQVDAAELELWMVNDKRRVVELGEELVHVDPNSDTLLSPPALDLSDFFKDVLDKKCIHIIAIAPGECHCFNLRAVSHSRTSTHIYFSCAYSDDTPPFMIVKHVYFIQIQRDSSRYLRTHQRRNTAHTLIFTLITHYLSTMLLSPMRR